MPPINIILIRIYKIFQVYLYFICGSFVSNIVSVSFIYLSSKSLAPIFNFR